MELVSQGQIEEALAVQRKEGGRLGQILIRLGYVSRDEVILALAYQKGVDWADLEEMPVDFFWETRDLPKPEDGVCFVIPTEQRKAGGDLDTVAGSAPVSRFLNLILVTALEANATELDFGIHDDGFDVRYRIEGIRYDMESVPLHLAGPVLARLRHLIGIDPAHPGGRLVAFATLQTSSQSYTVDAISMKAERGESVVLQLRRIP
jgi:type II secretory ATPase GspE/PulE/Tfp pilus assembly ATPase PilB-like protein